MCALPIPLNIISLLEFVEDAKFGNLNAALGNYRVRRMGYNPFLDDERKAFQKRFVMKSLVYIHTHHLTLGHPEFI